MDDSKKIKTLFNINAVSIISETENEEIGEATNGYEYGLDTSIPELAYALAGFLKAIDKDPDITEAAMLAKGATIGDNFITLLHQYYTAKE